MIERIPKKTNPALFDRVIADMQQGLADNLPWLNHSFGKAERLVKTVNGRRCYFPSIYIGRNEYEMIAPDSGFGNYSFFVLEDPQSVEWYVGEQSSLKTPFSLIVWVDMRTLEQTDERNTESVKEQILKTLNGSIWLKQGKFTINQVYEKAENVFKGFTLDEVDNQFLMQPFCGWRFTGVMTINSICI